MSTHITPPPDAKLPWSQRGGLIVDVFGNVIASVRNPSHEPYLITAANALPGLVEVCEKVVARGHYDTCSHALVEEHDCSCPVALAVAALAALTKEPTR